MSDKASSYDDYLKSLKIGYDNYDKQMNKIGFNYKDDDIEKPPRTIGLRNTRKGYAFDNYQNLINLVGSDKHKDIKMKKAFMSPAAFIAWQTNENHPSRQKWTAENIDLDNDGKTEFLVRDGKGNLIGVNGYFMSQSKYPERYAYNEDVKRDIKGKPTESYDEWRDRVMGDRDALYNRTNLDVNYADSFEKTTLFKVMSKYYDTKKKFPAKIRAFKHFSKVIYPTLVQAIKVCLPTYTTELKDFPQEVLNDLADCISYPGDSAVKSARFYSAQCFYAWNVNIMQPILHLPKIKAEIEAEKVEINKLLKSDEIFRENHQNDDIETLAINRLKSRKWFKDVVDKIYVMILSDKNTFMKFLTEIRDKFFLDYKAQSGNKLLFNEDKVYFFNKKHKNHRLKKSKYDIVDDDEDANSAFDSIVSELSSQVSREVSAETSPVKESAPKKQHSTESKLLREQKQTPKKVITTKSKKEKKEKKPNKDDELIDDEDSRSEFDSGDDENDE